MSNDKWKISRGTLEKLKKGFVTEDRFTFVPANSTQIANLKGWLPVDVVVFHLSLDIFHLSLRLGKH